MARRLKTLAKAIQAFGFDVELRAGHCNTDRKVGRQRHPGKGRKGTRLIVKWKGIVVLDHNAAETYRCNQEVEDWIIRRERGDEP